MKLKNVEELESRITLNFVGPSTLGLGSGSGLSGGGLNVPPGQPPIPPAALPAIQGTVSDIGNGLAGGIFRLAPIAAQIIPH